jgi:hypothetical protein
LKKSNNRSISNNTCLESYSKYKFDPPKEIRNKNLLHRTPEKDTSKSHSKSRSKNRVKYKGEIQQLTPYREKQKIIDSVNRIKNELDNLDKFDQYNFSNQQLGNSKMITTQRSVMDDSRSELINDLKLKVCKKNVNFR